MSSNKDLYLAFRGQIFEALDAEAVQKMSRRDLESQIQAAVDLLANSYQRPITSMMKSGLVKSLIDELFGLGPLQPLVEDQSISDIMVNGPNNIFFERHGKVKNPKFRL